MAGQPVVENGQLVTLARGPLDPILTVPFANGYAKVKWGGFATVRTDSLLGGVPFVATLVTSKLLVNALPVVLVGSTVTRVDGYTGVVPPTCGAGVKFTVD